MFSNDLGYPVLNIGCQSFICIGAKPPHDHPHIYLTLNAKGVINCPYCNTRYFFCRDLGVQQVIPSQVEIGTGEYADWHLEGLLKSYIP